MSEKLGPTMLLGAAKLLALQVKDLPEFSDASSLRQALRTAATPLIMGEEECSIGILDLAQRLQESTKEQIEAVLMRKAGRPTLGELPGVIDTQTPCPKRDFSAFMGARF